jgi:hypothetical protein
MVLSIAVPLVQQFQGRAVDAFVRAVAQQEYVITSTQASSSQRNSCTGPAFA